MENFKYSFIKLEDSESILRIKLNRLEKRNAFNPQLIYELCSVWDFLEENSNFKIAVLESVDESVFSSGADLKELIPILKNKKFIKDEFSEAVIKNNLLEKFYRKDKTYLKPVIGYASGYCLAGGFELLLSCDFKIVHENTILGFPETKLGLIPAGGGLSRITSLTSKSNALEILINSQKLNVEKLLNLGVINEIVIGNEKNKIIDKYVEKILNSSEDAVLLLMKNIDLFYSKNLKEKFILEAKLLDELNDEK